MGEAEQSVTIEELQAKITDYERRFRKLNREITHLKQAIAREKTAYTTVLNQQKASTFIVRERERYLALLLANSPSIILFLSQEKRVEFCTDYFIIKAGFKNVTEVLGHTLAEVFSPFLDDASQSKLLRESDSVTENNMPVSFDMAFRFNKDGEKEDFTGMLVPMKDEKQESKGLMLMFNDVTDLKRSREEALAASKAKGSFLSNMSHEIRTPLNAIIGMTYIAKKDVGDQRKVTHSLNEITTASTHLLGILNDVLDMSKIESGKLEIADEPFPLISSLSEVASIISQRCKEKSITFFTNVDKLPDIAVLGDKLRLSQVLLNLLGNAVKFTPEQGDIRLMAEVEEETAEDIALVFSVSDNGIGMTEEQTGKLFTAFQQADTGIASRFGGTGLGLAISQNLVNLMGGNITVRSEFERGSIFSFPLHFKKSSEPVQQESRPVEDYPDLSGKRILVAEDMRVNRFILGQLLEETGVEIEEAENGQETLDMFSGSVPSYYDLIFMDIQMPEMDGLEATAAIRNMKRSDAASIPIIAMTANAYREDIDKALAAGMNDHVAKPLDLDILMQTLSQYIG